MLYFIERYFIKKQGIMQFWVLRHSLDRFMKYKSDKHRVLYNSLIALPIVFVLFGSITGAVGYYTINPVIEYMINYY